MGVTHFNGSIRIRLHDGNRDAATSEIRTCTKFVSYEMMGIKRQSSRVTSECQQTDTANFYRLVIDEAYLGCHT